MTNQEKDFNYAYFRKILKLSKRYKLKKAILQFQEYLNQYPKDLDAYVHYADALIKNNQLREAEEVLNTVKSKLTKETATETFEDYIIIKVKLLCQQKRYKECYQLFRKNLEIYFQRNMYITKILVFLRKELGLLYPNDYNRKGYVVDQILSYEEEKAINHIKRHLSYDSEHFTKFADGFPIEEVYYSLRKRLPEECKYISGSITDLYLFKYENSGKISGRVVDFIEVVTLQDSNKIITMYPYENTELRAYTNYNYSNEETGKLQRII